MINIKIITIIWCNHIIIVQTRNFIWYWKFILNFVPSSDFWPDVVFVFVVVRLLNESKSTCLVFFGRTNIDLNEFEIVDNRDKIALLLFCWVELFNDDVDNKDDNDDDPEDDDEDVFEQSFLSLLLFCIGLIKLYGCELFVLFWLDFSLPPPFVKWCDSKGSKNVNLLRFEFDAVVGVSFIKFNKKGFDKLKNELDIFGKLKFDVLLHVVMFVFNLFVVDLSFS